MSLRMDKLCHLQPWISKFLSTVKEGGGREDIKEGGTRVSVSEGEEKEVGTGMKRLSGEDVEDVDFMMVNININRIMEEKRLIISMITISISDWKRR